MADQDASDDPKNDPIADPEIDPEPEPETETGPEDETRGRFRRHALPVLLGLVLGVACLALLRVLGMTVFLPFWPRDETPRPGTEVLPVTDERLRGVMDEMLLGTSGQGPSDPSSRKPEAPATPDEPWRDPVPDAACRDSVDCLVKRSGSAWEVRLSVDEEEPVGARIGALLRSARSGLLTFFVVEADGSVLRIYPTPNGDVPVVAAGEELHLPRREDRLRLRWSEPGPRRLVAVLSTEPFIPPAGESVGGLLTYYEAGSGVADAFFSALEGRIAADLSADPRQDAGAWSLAVAEVEVVAVEEAE